jgi:hypothetical protein
VGGLGRIGTSCQPSNLNPNPPFPNKPKGVRE